METAAVTGINTIVGKNFTGVFVVEGELCKAIAAR